MGRAWNPGLGAALLSVATSTAATAGPTPLPQGEYVTIQDGHLHYAGRRIRLWGVNIVGAPKRKGEDLVLSFERMIDAGFNAVRLNLVDATFQDRDADNIHSVPVTEKGSGTPIDRMDHAIWLARKRGMFFWVTFGVNKKLAGGDYDVMPDAGDRERWLEMAGTVPPAHLVYIDERAERAHQEFARSLLEHVNPYTDRRYADEEAIGLYEIFNENSFVARALAEEFPGYAGEIMTARWNRWLRQKYQSDTGLTAAWGRLETGESLDAGSVRFAPTRKGVVVTGAGVQREYIGSGEEAKRYPYSRGEDVVRFVVHLYQGHTGRFTRFVRSLGKPRQGISVVPVTPSGEYGRNVQTYWAAVCGDFVSMGLYGFALRPWSVKPEDPFYPFVVRVNQHPMFEQPVDLFRLAGKPYLIYECNDYRPNPYSVEFPARIAAYAVLQDLDGVFWFNWDDAGYLRSLEKDEDYVEHRVPMPDSSYPNAALILANNEAALAAIRAGGTLFRSGAVPPAPSPAQATFGRDMLLDLARSWFDAADEGADVESALRTLTWSRGTRVCYAPDGESKLPSPVDRAPGHLDAGPHISFDWQSAQGHIRIDAPGAKLFCGFLSPHLAFDGLTVTGIDRNWGTISVIAEDGLPLDQSDAILVTAVSRGMNRGMRLAPERLNTKDYWQQGLAQMIASPGKGPPVVDRIAARFRADWLEGLHYAKFDFKRTCFEKGRLTNTLQLNGYDPLFYARLTRPTPVLVRRMVVLGHSITQHGPSSKLGWHGDWGMAASAREKDWAHLLRTRIETAQGDVKVDLAVRNLLATRLGREAKEGVLGRYADPKADVVLIQIGDNLPKEKATKDTLERPYEQLIAEIKRANPKVHVFGLSTWGACSHRNELMRRACSRQGAHWIYVSHLIGDVENRAVSEERFSHGGVNWHPGDRGMAAIVETVLRSLQEMARIGIVPKAPAADQPRKDSSTP